MNDSTQPEQSCPPPDSGAVNPAIIVVIDDEPGMRLFVADALRSAGYTVLEAPEGEEGMRLVTKHLPWLLITDLVMPGQEGIETIMQARKKFPSMRIIAMSGVAYGGTYLDMAENLGANAVLVKPMRASALIAAVKALAPAQNAS